MKSFLLGAAFCAALTVTGVPVAAVGPATSPAAPASGLERFGGCLAGGGPGDVLLVLDRSASLDETDPDDARVDSAGYLVEQLAAYADGAGADIDLAIAGFDVDFELVHTWQRLDAGTADAVVKDLDTFRDEQSGFETDYWTALKGARDALSARAGEGDRCQAVVWFSDGRYDLDVRDTITERDAYGTTKPYAKAPLTTRSAEEAAEAAGQTDLCRDGGLADQLRVQDVVTLAVGLRAPGSDTDFSLMTKIATGSGGCGSVRQPAGEFYLANQIDDLLFAFDRFANPGSPPVSRESQVCANRACAAEAHRFVLDASISRMHILGSSSVAGAVVELDGPGDGPVRMEPGVPGSTKLSGADVTWEWLSDTAVQLDATRTQDRGWVGDWSLTFIDPGATTPGGRAMSNIHLYGDLQPTWTNLDQVLRSGDTASIDLGLARADGSSVDLAAVTSRVDLAAELELADGSTVPVASGFDVTALGDPVEVSLEGALPGAATLRLTLAVTTVSPNGGIGTALEPTQLSLPATVLPPASYPVVAPDLDLGSSESSEPFDVVLPVDGTGCVWLEGHQTTTLPIGAEQVLVESGANSRESCVGVDGSGGLPLSVTPAGSGNGLASGDLQVLTLPEDGVGEPVPAVSAYQLTLRPPVDTDQRLWVFIVVTALGLLLPLAMIYLVKWWYSRIPGDSVLVASAGSTSGGPNAIAGEALRLTDFRNMVLANSAGRSLTLPSGGVLRARMGAGLTEPGHLVAETPGRISGALRPGSSRKGRARLPLAVQNTWFVVLDQIDPARGPVEVVYLLDTSGTELGRLVADAQRRAPGLVTDLRASVPSGDAERPTDSDRWDDDASPTTRVPSGDEW